MTKRGRGRPRTDIHLLLQLWALVEKKRRPDDGRRVSLEKAAKTLEAELEETARRRGMKKPISWHRIVKNYKKVNKLREHLQFEEVYSEELDDILTEAINQQRVREGKRPLPTGRNRRPNLLYVSSKKNAIRRDPGKIE